MYKNILAQSFFFGIENFDWIRSNPVVKMYTLPVEKMYLLLDLVGIDDGLYWALLGYC